MPGPLAVSYSRASLFDKCRYRFNAEYIEKVPRPSSIPLEVGRLLHDLADQYTKHLIKTKQQSDYMHMEKLFDAIWEGKAKEYPSIPEQMHDELHELSVKLREVIIISPDNILGSEQRLAFTAEWKKTGWYDDNTWLRLVMDRLEMTDEGLVSVHDYKTGYRIDSDPMQLRLYATGVKALMPDVEMPIYVTLHFIRQETSRSEVIDEAAIEGARRWIEHVSRAIEACRKSGVWPATPGEGCYECPVFKKCPERKIAIEFRSPQTEEEAKRILGRYVLLEVEHKNLQEALKSWVKVNGPLSANGVVALLATIVKKNYPVPELEMGFKELGVTDTTRYLQSNNKELAKLAKKDKEVEKFLKTIVDEKPENRFTVKRGKEE